MIPDVAHIDEPYWFMHGGDLTPQEFGLRCARQLEEKIRNWARKTSPVLSPSRSGRGRYDLPAGKLLAGDPTYLPAI